MPSLRRHRILVLLFVFSAFALGGWWMLRWFAFREWRRAELSYYTEMLELHKSSERRLRDALSRLRRGDDRDADGHDLTDQVFEMLQSSRVANNSEEVRNWRNKPPSPERGAVARKWAECAADQDAYMSILYEIWIQDLKRGQMSHDISDKEVPPPRSGMVAPP